MGAVCSLWNMIFRYGLAMARIRPLGMAVQRFLRHFTNLNGYAFQAQCCSVSPNTSPQRLRSLSMIRCILQQGDGLLLYSLFLLGS